MAVITFLDNEYATLWYYVDKKIIHYRILQYIYGDKLKELFSTGTEVLKKYKAGKWISDDGKNCAFTKQDREWVNTMWLPDAARQGLKCWAIVGPEDTAVSTGENLFIQDGIIVGVFPDLNVAMDWLIKQ